LRYIPITKTVENCPLCGQEHTYNDIMPYNSAVDQKVKPTPDSTRTYVRELNCPTNQQVYCYEFVWEQNFAVQE
jgi:hypothetical protein